VRDARSSIPHRYRVGAGSVPTTVWKFNSPTAANEALGTRRELEREHLINIIDGAIFFLPKLGMAIGAGIGALMGSLQDVGA
jgi:uncharacterized membrane protein